MSESLSYAGEFILEKVEIVAAGDDRVDLTKTTLQIDIWEDIEEATLSGSIVFTDNFGLVNSMPIIGQETLRLKIRTPSVISGGQFGEEQVIDRLFYVNAVGGGLNIKPNVSVVTLEFVSMELVRNNRTIVDRILTGTYSDIAKQMLKNDLKTKKTVFVEKSSGVKKIVANELTPIEILDQCKREAISEENGQPTYKMFETLTGFHFRSVQSMYATESAQRYTVIENETSEGGVPNVLAEYSRIKDYNIDRSPDTMTGTMDGQFSSEMTIHDIYNKDIIVQNFNYFDEFEPGAENFTINKYHKKPAKAMYSKTALDQEGSTLASASTKKFLASISLKDQETGTDASLTTGDGRYAFQAPNPDRWLQKRQAFNKSLQGGFIIDIVAYGHTHMRAGQVVDISIPRQARNKQEKDDPLDRFYRGPFLVAACHHKFDVGGEHGPTHNIFLQCVKDCVDEELEFVETLPQDIDDTFFEADPVVEDFYQDEIL